MDAFEPPAPGTWEQDRSHMPTRASRYTGEVMPDPYNRGMAEAMETWGVPLQGIDLANINGYFYVRVRPVGAPEEAKGPPPAFILKIMSRLHPELRRRNRRVRQVFETRFWREEGARFREEWLPGIRARNLTLQQEDPADLDDHGLAAHLDRARDLLRDATFMHHRVVVLCSLTVGDFVAHVQRWTGRNPAQIFGVFRGHSSSSTCCLTWLAPVVAALEEQSGLRARVLADQDHADVLQALRQADGALGLAVEAWLERQENRPISGFDVADASCREMPEVLVRALLAQLGGIKPGGEAEGDALADELRGEVPREDRAAFDELLAEARFAYGVRDERNDGLDDWSTGLTRRALLEVGARLASRGRLLDAAHAVDLTHDEALALLAGEEGPSAEQVAEWVALRENSRPEDAPDFVGAPPAPPPSPACFPAPSRRCMEAMAAYVEGMFHEHEPEAEQAPGVGVSVKGLAASAGRSVGRARLVLRPEEFSKVEQGDVLVARATAPAYNVLLPMLAGIVTDRGGLLSHPAIVSREYGIPGVVGTRDATTVIPDGARVEVDGDAGIVRLLS